MTSTGPLWYATSYTGACPHAYCSQPHTRPAPAPTVATPTPAPAPLPAAAPAPVSFASNYAAPAPQQDLVAAPAATYSAQLPAVAHQPHICSLYIVLAVTFLYVHRRPLLRHSRPRTKPKMCSLRHHSCSRRNRLPQRQLSAAPNPLELPWTSRLWPLGRLWACGRPRPQPNRPVMTD